MRTGRPNPCHGCPDRYTACSDHCTKDSFLAWREEQARIRQARNKNRQVASYTVDMIRKNRRK